MKPSIPVFQSLCALFMALFPTQVFAAQSEKADDHRRLVAHYYSLFQQPGFRVDDLLEFYADDIEFSDPTFEIEARGKEAFRKLYADIGTERTSYSDIEWELKTVLVEGDDVGIYGRWSGKFHDCPFKIEFVTLWHMRANRIARQTDFFAADTFDRQVGWDGKKTACAD